VRFEAGHIEFRPAPGAPRDLANRLGKHLSDWTGARWVVSVSQALGEPTWREQSDLARRQRLAAAAEHPLVRAALAAFPGATIAEIRDRGGVAEPALEPPAEAAPPIEEIPPALPGDHPLADHRFEGPALDADDPGPFGDYPMEDGEPAEFDD
jgi:DNA polymerase-3 subunit gamma/tau